MKNKFSLILFSALLSTTFAWAQNPAYYELPEGAFAQGLSSTSAPQTAKFFLPHAPGKKYTFVSKNAGLWTSGSGTTTKPSKVYSYTSQMKKEFHTPQLAVDDDKYQYGSDGGEYQDNLYFRVGDSLRYYMTPATMYNDTGKLVLKTIGNYNSKNRDTVGLFFNNTDVMYISAISIPISYGSSGKTKNDMFPKGGSHVVVNIYKATTTSAGKKTNQVDRSDTLWTYTFTKDDFKEYSTSSFRGALSKTFTDALFIDGAFVVELTEMKKTGCDFYVYSVQERSGGNKWGYYVGDDGTETYPDYTPAISVQAMFPALYTDGSLEVKIPAGGASKDQKNRPDRTVYANYKYEKNKNGWSFETSPNGYGISIAFNESSNDYVKWLFTMSANTTPNVRDGYVTFTFRGKQLQFHLIQPPVVNSISISETTLSLDGSETPTLTATVLPDTTTQKVTWVSEDTTIAKVDADGKVTATGAGTTTIKAISADPDKFATCTVTVTPTLTPRIGTDNKQTFTFLAAGDDTLLINGIKTTKIYLDSEVKLSDDNIVVESSQGLTKIGKEYGENTNSIRLTLTRKQFVPEEATDIVAVYFKNNQNIRYEYSITQAGVGKLRPDTTSRTFVVGPKGGKALFLNDDNTVGDRYVRLYCDVPATNIAASYYGNHFCTLSHSSSTDIEGRYYKSVSASVDSETTEERLDSFRVYLPGCDTIKFYVRQETTPRVWRHNTTQLTQLEVNNQGGLAHFKGFLTQKVTIVSNTPGTLDINEVEIAFSDGAKEWITPDKTVNSTGDSVFITFDVKPLTDPEPRSTDITVSILENEFTVPLTQKTFGIEWSNNGYDEELVVPIAGGKAYWKDSYYPNLNVYCTEPYRDALLKVTAPEGVEITRQTDTLTTGRQATYIMFSKKDTLTADWSGEITVKFDSINTDEGFDYHFSKTFTITQAAAKVWLADDQQPLVIAAEGGESNVFTIWSNMNIPLTDWEVTQKPEWLGKISGVSTGQEEGSYYRTFKTSATANTDTEKREGTITIKHTTLTNLSVEINISQDPLTTYTRTVTSGKWGTICLPYAAASFTGAEMYSIAGKMEGNSGIYLDQVTAMEAGEPYIFKATAGKIEVVYAAGEAKEAQTVNGLCGYIGDDYKTIEPNDDNYIVYNNALYLVDSEVKIASNRAYIHYDNELGTPSTAPQIRRVAMPINNAPTSMLQVNEAQPAVKILRDGHIVILRDNKEYNILGQSK